MISQRVTMSETASLVHVAETAGTASGKGEAGVWGGRGKPGLCARHKVVTISPPARHGLPVNVALSP